MKRDQDILMTARLCGMSAIDIEYIAKRFDALNAAQPPCGADGDLIADICNAYESGVGHRGRPTADVNPYPPDAPQYRVYQLGALNNDDVPDEKWAFMSLKLIEQKEVQVPESFVEYMRKNYPEGTVIADGAWHARPIWNAARHAMLASQPAAPVAPATVAGADGWGIYRAYGSKGELLLVHNEQKAIATSIDENNPAYGILNAMLAASQREGGGT